MPSYFPILFRGFFLFVALTVLTQLARTEVVFESASGAADSSGVLLADDAWLFHNFEITEQTQLGEVGGFFQTFNTAQVFGAVVALSNGFDFPDSFDLSSQDLLGSTVFDLPDTGINGGEFSGALPLSLSPGWYALGFGTGAFGAAPAPTFSVSMPSLASDLAPNELPYSQFQDDHSFVPNSRIFQVATPRFSVKSATASADFDGNGFVDGNDLQKWKIAYGANDSADADNDEDSDGADFLAWQRQFAPALTSLLINGDFETGSLSPWTPVVTANGDVSFGFPRVESFDVDGDGEASSAMRIRVGQQDFDFQTPAGGGIEQTFSLDTAGNFSITADIASTNLDIGGNGGPGRFDLLVDGVLIDSVDMNGMVINPGEVFRDSLSGTVVGLGVGEHSVEILVLRAAVNSRKIYQFVDNVSLTRIGAAEATQVVPEPMALTLLCFGFAISMFRGRGRSTLSWKCRGSA